MRCTAGFVPGCSLAMRRRTSPGVRRCHSSRTVHRRSLVIHLLPSSIRDAGQRRRLQELPIQNISLYLPEKHGKMTKKTTYSKAYSRLQEILQLIEGDQLGIDELREKIREAAALVKICREKLFTIDDEVKKAIEDLK
jgi:exodeoxyribonuclease VII small subunit